MEKGTSCRKSSGSPLKMWKQGLPVLQKFVPVLSSFALAYELKISLSGEDPSVGGEEPKIPLSKSCSPEGRTESCPCREKCSSLSRESWGRRTLNSAGRIQAGRSNLDWEACTHVRQQRDTQICCAFCYWDAGAHFGRFSGGNKPGYQDSCLLLASQKQERSD